MMMAMAVHLTSYFQQKWAIDGVCTVLNKCYPLLPPSLITLLVTWISEIGLFPPLKVDVSSSVASHARSRIVNVVCDMTSRQKMKGTNISGSAEAATSCVILGDIQKIMAKWNFRCLLVATSIMAVTMSTILVTLKIL